MTDDTCHERITIDVTTYGDKILVRACTDHDPHSPLFDVNMSRDPGDAVSDVLGAMSKVLKAQIRGFVYGAKPRPASPARSLLDYIPGLPGAPTAAELLKAGTPTKGGKR